MSRRDIEVSLPVLTRVEGEGALELEVEGGRIRSLALRIFEPPRYFEKFLEGRDAQEVIDIVARICGICPVAYQLTAAEALEGLAEVVPPDWARAMRHVMYCGEWLQSHALHIHLLALPDLFEVDSVVQLAALHPEPVRRGLRLQTLGNDLIALFGGRSVHPVGIRPGGLFHAPEPAAVRDIRERLDEALEDAMALLVWLRAQPLPGSAQSFPSVAVGGGEGHPFFGTEIHVSDGSRIAVAEFGSMFEEVQVPHSTAFHALYRGRPYLVGPLARLNLFADRLPDFLIHELARLDIRFPSGNPFHSLLARAVEIIQVIHMARELLSHYAQPQRSAADWSPRAGVAVAGTEAPRGLLWHRYELDASGAVRSARIVPPTSQNQARIEADLRASLEALGLDRSDTELRMFGERIIRNYDPCISCATHFLRFRVKRDQAGCDDLPKTC
ncbi:Ni/Fe hydrogenase subunit alpha [Thiohalobacter sp.]|uniref:Ni/Fe hydrogenase subunit alpha n=1 Tax=Thiohalobacter sp. TaxID=2025948 RepID=UPI0026375DCF|nr:nickel-dependent hydrogenase large subunit [Thiohalobacter sp.]